MLSRVAERVYWLARYMERVENTARLINVNTNLLLDLPRGARVGWGSLIDITGGNAEFRARGLKAEEAQIVRFLLADPNNNTSIFNSIRMARENARTTREIIPTEAWELINGLYLRVKEDSGKSVARAQRQQFLRSVVREAQQLIGKLAGTMSHTNAYDFIRIGRNLERADMSTRIVDVGAVNLITNSEQRTLTEDAPEPFINTLWMSVLQSLSAYQMYRQHVQDRIKGEKVVAFLLQDSQFPRSVLHCLDAIGASLAKLPHSEEVKRETAVAQRHLDSADIASILRKGALHEFIDEIQRDLADIHVAIARQWFLPVVDHSAA